MSTSKIVCKNSKSRGFQISIKNLLVAIAIISALFALDQYLESKTTRLMSELVKENMKTTDSVSAWPFQKDVVKIDDETTLLDRILLRRRFLVTRDNTDGLRGGTIKKTPYLVSLFQTESGLGSIAIVMRL